MDSRLQERRPEPTGFDAVKDLQDFQNGLGALRTPEHLVDIVKANGADSPLLQLPAEIRNMIYEYAFTPRNVGDSIAVFGKPEHRYWHKGGCPCPSGFQLFSVCRQIYSEACTVPFSKFILDFSRVGAYMPMETMRDWLGKINKVQRESIWFIENNVSMARVGDDELMNNYKEMGQKLVPHLEWSHGYSTVDGLSPSARDFIFGLAD